MKNNATSPWFKAAPSVPSIKQITAWSERQRIRAFLNGAAYAQNGAVIIGKLFYALQADLSANAARQALRDAGATEFAVSKAEVFARSFALVAEGKITEKEYDALSYAEGVRVLRRFGKIVSRVEPTEALIPQAHPPRKYSVDISLRRAEFTKVQALSAEMNADPEKFMVAAALLVLQECQQDGAARARLLAVMEKRFGK